MYCMIWHTSWSHSLIWWLVLIFIITDNSWSSLFIRKEKKKWTFPLLSYVAWTTLWMNGINYSVELATQSKRWPMQRKSNMKTKHYPVAWEINMNVFDLLYPSFLLLDNSQAVLTLQMKRKNKLHHLWWAFLFGWFINIKYSTVPQFLRS